LLAAHTGKGAEMENEHEFTLILDGITDFSPSIVDALFEAGCDDATISKQGDVVFMDFDRSAPSMKEAVISAIADVQKAGMKVARVDGSTPDPTINQNMAPLFAVVNGTLQISSITKQDPSLRIVVDKILDYAASA
jgi:hypothetical protein